MNHQQNNQELLNKISDFIQEVKFGSIELTIHEGIVVSIERKEKIRIEQSQRDINRSG